MGSGHFLVRKKFSTPRRRLPLTRSATLVLLLMVIFGYVYVESPRFLIRSLLRNPQIAVATTVEVRTPSGEYVLDEDESRRVVSDMARADHTDTWDFYSSNFDLRNGEGCFNFTLVFHFPLGFSTSIFCAKQTEEDYFACWTTKDSAIYELFVWRDPDEWHVPLSSKYRFIEWAHLTSGDSLHHQSVGVRD